MFYLMYYKYMDSLVTKVKEWTHTRATFKQSERETRGPSTKGKKSGYFTFTLLQAWGFNFQVSTIKEENLCLTINWTMIGQHLVPKMPFIWNVSDK